MSDEAAIWFVFVVLAIVLVISLMDR